MMDERKENLLKKVFGTPRQKPRDPAELTEQEIELLSEILAENEELLGKIVARWESSRVIELQSILPKNAVMSRAKLREKLCKEIINGGKFETTVNPKNRKETLIFFELSSMHDNTPIVPKNCTPYDLVVMDAICTLWEIGNKTMTPEMIYRAMNGYTEQERVSPQAVAAVTRSIDKMRMTYTKIDFTEEAKMRNLHLDSFILEGAMIAADKVAVSVGGYKKTAYRFLRSPLLHEYSRKNNYLLSIPLEVVNTKQAIQSTPEIIVIRSYLIRRIEAMKGKNHVEGNKIRYESIFEKCEIAINNNKAKHKYVSHVKKLLDYWKSQGYIKGYKEYKKGRVIEGVEIFYTKEKD